MKTNGKREVIARIGRQSLVLVAFLATALCFAGPSRAQSNAAAKPAASAEKNSASGAKGPQEGIIVHGHWTIEVRNPDGSTVRHVEFENGIDPGFSLTFVDNSGDAFGSSVPGGTSLLNAMLSGQAAPSPNAWGIILAAPGGLANALSTSTNAPCLVNLNLNLANPDAGESNAPASFTVTAPTSACMLLPPPSNATSSNLLLISNPCTNNLPGISCNVASPAPGSLAKFSLSGTVIANNQGSVGTVAAVNYGWCGNLSGSSCPLNGPPASVQGNGNVESVGQYMVSFTSTSNFTAVPVIAGQTVYVSVTFTFSSSS